MRDIYTGIFYVNAPTIGAEVHLPFGGTKATGNGHREAGIAALDCLFRVEVDLCGLQRPTAASANRHAGAMTMDHPGKGSGRLKAGPTEPIFLVDG
jgi:hypothetical protein